MYASSYVSLIIFVLNDLLLPFSSCVRLHSSTCLYGGSSSGNIYGGVRGSARECVGVYESVGVCINPSLWNNNFKYEGFLFSFAFLLTDHTVIWDDVD